MKKPSIPQEAMPAGPSSKQKRPLPWELPQQVSGTTEGLPRSRDPLERRRGRPTTVKLRERKKDATRHALLAAANKRFHHAGYEATTIDEVCQYIGVSRRTFFRYFPDKESLAFPHRRERLERFVELLASAPANEGPVGGL